MRLKDLKENDQQLDEILPVLGAVAAGVGRVAAGAGQAAVRGAQAAGGAVVRGVSRLGQAVGKGLQTAAQKTTQAAGQAAQAGLAGGQMDPAQAAQAKKDHDEQKKQIQDAIKEKQAEISDLQKQLAQLG